MKRTQRSNPRQKNKTPRHCEGFSPKQSTPNRHTERDSAKYPNHANTRFKCRVFWILRFALRVSLRMTKCGVDCFTRIYDSSRNDDKNYPPTAPLRLSLSPPPKNPLLPLVALAPAPAPLFALLKLFLLRS